MVSAAPDLDPLLAAPGLLALGRPAELRSLLDAAPTDGATTPIGRFAKACLAACSGEGAVPLFVEVRPYEDTLPMTHLALDDVRCVGATFVSLVGDHRARASAPRPRHDRPGASRP